MLNRIIFLSQGRQLGIRHIAVLAALVFCLPFLVLAQDASLVGTVTDPSGSVIPNVKITISNLETGLSHTTNTNDSGQYFATDLRVGHYNVKAEAAGFKVAAQKGLVLNVGDRTRVDFQMVLGGAQETVTVEANAVRVQSDSGEMSNVIDERQMSQIAVSGATTPIAAAAKADKKEAVKEDKPAKMEKAVKEEKKEAAKAEKKSDKVEKKADVAEKKAEKAADKKDKKEAKAESSSAKAK